MILAFRLSMPNCASWNGKWSGEGRKYVIVKTFKSKKQIEQAQSIVKTGYYHYSWSDGWGAGIRVSEVDSAQARKLRKESQGFAGYNWMVDSIMQYGKILADHEIQAHLDQLKSANKLALSESESAKNVEVAQS
jgi:hypothetical protein